MCREGTVNDPLRRCQSLWKSDLLCPRQPAGGEGFPAGAARGARVSRRPWERGHPVRHLFKESETERVGDADDVLCPAPPKSRDA